MARPWDIPHFELPHHACSVGQGWWRGPAAGSPECQEALDGAGVMIGPPLPDGSCRYRLTDSRGHLTRLAAGPVDDPWCRAHWIAARLQAAIDAEGAAPPPPAFLAILNLTDDSFSDGGQLGDAAALLGAAEARIAEGASWLDLGAESTRPGARAVPAERQLERLLPAIEALAPLGAPLSIDTRSALVAEQCLAAGASMINDVSGLSDPAMAEIVAEAGAALCVMHSRGTPATMGQQTGYRFVLGAVIDELARPLQAALAAGVAPAKLLVDPGIGFAKDAEQSLALLGRTRSFRALGLPVLVGPSRKSCLGAVLGERAPRDRDGATAGAAALAASQGAAMLRLHRGGEVWDAVLAAAAAARAAHALTTPATAGWEVPA